MPQPGAMSFYDAARHRQPQNLVELQIVYWNTPPLFYDETGEPDPHGSFIRLPDGRFSTVMAIDNSLASLGTRGDSADFREVSTRPAVLEFRQRQGWACGAPQR